MPEPLDRLLDSQLVISDLLQQSFYLFSLNISPVLVSCHSEPFASLKDRLRENLIYESKILRLRLSMTDAVF